MAKIAMFMLCNRVATEGTDTNLISPQLALRPDFIPGNFSFGLCVGISAVQPEDEKIQFTIIGPSEVIIHEASNIPLNNLKVDNNVPLEARGFIVSIDARNVCIEQEGEYRFILTINGEETDSRSFYIYKKRKL